MSTNRRSPARTVWFYVLTFSVAAMLILSERVTDVSLRDCLG